MQLKYLLAIGLLHLTPKACAQQDTSKTSIPYYSPGGTYSDWFFPKEDIESLEWTFVPVADPSPSLKKEGLLHYYAYNFGVENATSARGNGYAGLQTNGIFKNKQKGKVINFSIWGSNGGKTSGWLNDENQESSGFQIMYPFPWIVQHQYAFELKQGPSGIDSLGKWWGLWVTDLNTHKTIFVGEQRVAKEIEGKSSIHLKPHSSMFGEDLHWWKSNNGNVKYSDCKSFQSSACAAVNISANNGKIQPIKFTNFTNSGKIVNYENGFKTINCQVSIYNDSTNFNVQHNLGNWSPDAPNYLQSIKSLK
ncbi:hypothetical protein [Rhizosphaericola mali]|uniref:DUF3472 domain-containing protein n=1 Tax=Rhizosphaericola mali TaxID=2545455 RepID=A0A5P2FXV2_9BACT|nr:hypothetical protein [Rhizosphaericola mali]QES87218.1 hypothetical protein E0W69_000585 [Rhizosphaericola mali]